MLATAKTFLNYSAKKLPFSAPILNYTFSNRYDAPKNRHQTEQQNDHQPEANQQ